MPEHADPAAHGPRVGDQVLAEDPRLAGGHPQQSRAGSQDAGLAGPVGALEQDDLAPGHVEIDAREDGKPADKGDCGAKADHGVHEELSNGSEACPVGAIRGGRRRAGWPPAEAVGGGRGGPWPGWSAAGGVAPGRGRSAAGGVAPGHGGRRRAGWPLATEVGGGRGGPWPGRSAAGGAVPGRSGAPGAISRRGNDFSAPKRAPQGPTVRRETKTAPRDRPGDPERRHRPPPRLAATAADPPVPATRSGRPGRRVRRSRGSPSRPHSARRRTRSTASTACRSRGAPRARPGADPTRC